MSNVPPRRPPDSRREPDSVDDDLPTDVTRRGTLLPSKPRLRLEAVPHLYDEGAGPSEQTEVGRGPSGAAMAGAALPSNVHARLEVMAGEAEPTVHELTMVRTEIGRGLQADVRFKDRRVSRRNTIIVFVNDEFRIRDLGSGNGTLLNGSRVGEYVLKDGDEVTVGRTKLIFRLKGA
jgi:hypothetical protein